MTRQLRDNLISIVIPVYNESAGLPDFHRSLQRTIKKIGVSYELIYCDDGSTDSTAELIRQWHTKDSHIKLIKLSRNFGKENALSAGIAQANGQAVLTIDGDGQHPVELIPTFIRKWQDGSQVVIGVRTRGSSEGWFKRFGSKIFYQLFTRVTGERLVPPSTDYRLMDKAVQQEFLKLTESDRITRGLIYWLGFKRDFIKFEALRRHSGAAGYNRRGLMRLATHSFVSFTPMPLYLFGFLGVFITIAAMLLGSAVFIEQVIFNDPWHWNFTGTAMIGILLLFLVGLILMSQGMLSLYISHIHSQTKRRPLYVIDYEGSAGVKKIQ